MQPTKYISTYKELEALKESYQQKNLSSIEKLEKDIDIIESEINNLNNQYSDALINTEDGITEEQENQLLHEIEVKKSRLAAYKKALDKCYGYDVYKEPELREIATKIHEEFNDTINALSEQAGADAEAAEKLLEQLFAIIEKLYSSHVDTLHNLAAININVAKYYDENSADYLAKGYSAGKAGIHYKSFVSTYAAMANLKARDIIEKINSFSEQHPVDFRSPITSILTTLTIRE